MLWKSEKACLFCMGMSISERGVFFVDKIKSMKSIVFEKIKANKKTIIMCSVTMLVFVLVMTVPAFAANKSIFDRAKTIMNKIYKDIVGISTVTAGLAGTICLGLCGLSKTQKTVDEARTWGKRIIICYLGIMLMSSIVYYMSNNFTFGTADLIKGTTK